MRRFVECIKAVKEFIFHSVSTVSTFLFECYYYIITSICITLRVSERERWTKKTIEQKIQHKISHRVHTLYIHSDVCVLLWLRFGFVFGALATIKQKKTAKLLTFQLPANKLATFNGWNRADSNRERVLAFGTELLVSLVSVLFWKPSKWRR